MSHYCEIELRLTGEAEAIVRALLEMDTARGIKWKREDIEVHAERQSLYGFRGDVRPQKAHIIIRRSKVQSGANDLGLEKRADGSWVLHVSEYDRNYYNSEWEKRLLSKWAVQRTGLEAERRGYRWNVNYTEENGQQFAYVHIVR